jgi:hypothetical protein
MNKAPFIALGLLAAAGLSPASAADGVPPAAIIARAKQTKARIDVLFRHRNEAPAPVGPNQNPFRTSSDVPVPTADTSPAGQAAEVVEPPAPTSDDNLLKQAVATLKIGGTVILAGGQIHVSINQETYKEGGSIITRIQGTVVILNIRRITASSVTFALNDSVLTLAF